MNNEPATAAPNQVDLKKLDGEWEHIVVTILHKHYRHTGITITQNDLNSAVDDIAAGKFVLLTQMHADHIDLKLVSDDEAARIAAANNTLIRATQ